MFNFFKKKEEGRSVFSNPEQRLSDNDLSFEEEAISAESDNKKKDKYSRNVKFEFWYLEKEKKIKLIRNIILIVISSVTWGIFIYSFGSYIVFGGEEENKLITKITSSNLPEHNEILDYTAQNIKYSVPQIIKTTTGKYDFVAQIANTNDNHWAEFNYYFSGQEDESDFQTGFILPGEKKYLFVLNQKAKTNVTELNILDLKWHRIFPREIADWQNFKDERFNISISNIDLQRSDTDKGLAILKFEALNNSAYSFWNIRFNILLLNNQKIVGVNKYLVSEFNSREKKEILLYWPGISAGNNFDIRILPEVNIIDANNYIAL